MRFSPFLFSIFFCLFSSFGGNAARNLGGKEKTAFLSAAVPHYMAGEGDE